MTNKKLVVLLIFCLIIAGILLFISFYVTTTAEKYDETNSTEHTATVRNLETNSRECKIFTYEYQCALRIELEEIVDEKLLDELYDGVEINFRIPAFYDDLLDNNDIQTLNIVSLETDNATIVTLESHNNMIENHFLVIKITGIVFSGLFLIGACVCSIMLYRCRKNNIT